MASQAVRIEPGPGQESVWDYPRPPRLERSQQRIRVLWHGFTLAETKGAFRVLETSHPPVYYISPADVDFTHLVKTTKRTFCEWKGMARYFDAQAGGAATADAAWCYDSPTRGMEPIAGHLSFYASKCACYVDDELATAQAGDFYGGWITSAIVGPFKGPPGTLHW